LRLYVLRYSEKKYIYIYIIIIMKSKRVTRNKRKKQRRTQKNNKEAKKYLDFFKNKPYIFNLGHGILPKTNPENVKKLVEFVRSYNL